jgi:4-diphosphocytidyl-2-C-methyl-D-erythritol kinase
LIVFPNSKINLGLHVLRKRSDGFHDLETIFYPVALQDALEIIHSPSGETKVTLSGLSLDTPQEDNICFKAWSLLKKDFADLPAVTIHLHKVIPSGAGLGGGSADGAFTLLLLNKKFNLGLSEVQLMGYALKLGSDCPFFILNKAAHAEGRGELLHELSLDLSAFSILLVNPGIHVSTAQAFATIKPSSDRTSLKTLIQKPPAEWRNVIKNDFESATFSLHPEIGTIKESLYSNGAIYASMSGSGSSVFGLFEKGTKAIPSFPSHYFTAWI